MDAFQGCYKDGTNGTQDCRYFAGLQLILRLLFPIIFFFFFEAKFSLFSCTIVLSLYTTLLVIVQPYKVAVYNKTDVPLLTALLVAFIVVLSCASIIFYNSSFHWLVISIGILCACTPLLYLVIWSTVYIKHIITHRTWCRKHMQEADQLLPHIK